MSLVTSLIATVAVMSAVGIYTAILVWIADATAPTSEKE